MKPDLRYTDRQSVEYLPSWSFHGQPFINAAHANIFKATEQLEGWQAPEDSMKLFEIAYYAGDVILEVGTYGGRSAIVELLGALSNPSRKVPQYFGIDIEPDAVVRTTRNLEAVNLGQYALIFLGDIQSFVAKIDITPTMVFLDGDHSYTGVKSDLNVLSKILAKNTPVLCHDYRGSIADQTIPDELPGPKEVTSENMWMGVQKACHEWEQSGFATFMGTFGCSALYLTTDKCSGVSGGLPAEKFNLYRANINEFYSNEFAKKGYLKDWRHPISSR